MGRYPEGWTEKPLKTLAVIVQGSTPASNDARYWSDEPTPFVWVTPADMNEFGFIETSSRYITQEGYNSCGTQLVPEGSVVISTRAPIGKVNLTSTQLCTNQGCKSLVPRDIEACYLYWAVLNAKEDLVLSGRGTTFMELSAYDLGHIKVPVPPKEEQRAIAALLDEKCAAIDATANTLETQISTLERYRASVIHEAVTRGLDPTAPTKPSNVDWIGNIPQGWETRRVKYVASIASGSTPSRDNLAYWDGDIPWVKTGELRNGLLSKTEEGITRKALVECSMTLYPAGTLLVAMYGQGKTRGMTAKLGVPCSINQACAALTPNESLVAGDYLWLCFIAGYEAIRAIAQGSGQPNLSADLIANFAIPLPPISEQGAIASVAFSRTAAIDAVIATKRKQLDVLKRRRQSLIYEYVTGKRRVSEEA